MKHVADREFLQGVDLARRLNRKAADHYTAHGLAADQVAIAAAYSAFDIAERMFIPPDVPADLEARRAAGVGAIEWLRTALDEMQRQLIDGGPMYG